MRGKSEAFTTSRSCVLTCMLFFIIYVSLNFLTTNRFMLKRMLRLKVDSGCEKNLEQNLRTPFWY